MGKSEKQIEKEKARNQRIIDTAFQIFVEKKIQNKTKNRFFPYDGLEEFTKRVQIGGKKKTAY